MVETAASSCETNEHGNKKYLLRWPVTGVFIVNETLNETRRNTQKLFSHHERNCSTKLSYKKQKTVRPSGEEGLVRGRAT